MLLLLLLLIPAAVVPTLPSISQLQCNVQVELLKVRFGEQAFSACDVMIKDIQVEPLTPNDFALKIGLLRNV